MPDEELHHPVSFPVGSYFTLTEWRGDQDGVAQQPKSSATPHGPPCPQVPTASPVHSADVILAEFYVRRSKKPTFQEQLELSRVSGLSPASVAEWYVIASTMFTQFANVNVRRFLDRRDADPSWTSGQTTQVTPWDIQKPRTRFSAEQKQFLEEYFQQNPTPSPVQRAHIAVELGVRSDAIYNWLESSTCDTDFGTLITLSTGSIAGVESETNTAACILARLRYFTDDSPSSPRLTISSHPATAAPGYVSLLPHNTTVPVMYLHSSQLA